MDEVRPLDPHPLSSPSTGEASALAPDVAARARQAVDAIRALRPAFGAARVVLDDFVEDDRR